MLITISNARSKRVNANITQQLVHTPGKNVYLQTFMLVGVSGIEILLFNRKKKKRKQKTVKIEITNITPFLYFFQISLAFNMFSTLVLIEVKWSGN